MPMLSLREASRRFAVSRVTLAKHLENGKVSGSRDADGNWQIDAAELSRVYAARTAHKADASRDRPDHAGHDGPPPEPSPEPSAGRDMELRLARAEAELAAEREKTALLERHLDDLRRMLPPPDAPRRRWWPW